MQAHSLQTLEAMGMCLTRVRLRSVKAGLYGRYLLTFTHSLYSMAKSAKKQQSESKGVKLHDSKL